MNKETTDNIVLVCLYAISIGMVVLVWMTIDSMFKIIMLTLLNLITLGGANLTFGYGISGLTIRDVLLSYVIVGLVTLGAVF